MKLYFHYFSLHLRSLMEHKKSFFLMTLGNTLATLSLLLGMLFLFQRFHGVKGFTLEEVMVCFSATLLGYALAETFFRGFDLFPSLLANGSFDRILVRPRSAIFQVLAGNIELGRLAGRMLQAILMAGYSFGCGAVDWRPDRVLCLILMVAGTFCLFSGLFLIYAAISFFTTEGLEIMNILTNGGQEFGSYPLVIYGKQVLFFTTFFIPLACVQYYPLLYLLGRSQNPLLMLLPLAGAAFYLPAWLFWRVGVRHFKSTGS